MRSTNGLIAVVLLACLPACRGNVPVVPHAQAVALELFELACQAEPDARRVDELFAGIEDERARAVLLDAISALRCEGDPVMVDSYDLDERRGFDFEVALQGDGAARYSVVVDPRAAAGTIVWFSGPDVEWPEHRSSGTGLSTSAPPLKPEGR